MQLLIAAVLALLVIAAATPLGPRVGVAAPLVLVLVGFGVSILPFTPNLEIEPEWILAGVLPPLLYSASVSMPAMNFRREFGAISGLSVVLVLASSVILGLFFAWIIPGIGLAWGIALGAIVSPTDAVATSIVKRTRISPRVVALLEGESLLNDATALVLLRTAIASVAASISFWSVAGNFVFSVLLAAILGFVVGRLNLFVRAHVSDATVNTVLSFTVPFIASIPAELLGASGLVAAVVAGLVTGRRAPRVLSPEHRLSDAQNWRTIELVLEGGVFLVMGLELSAVVSDVAAEHAGVLPAFGIAAAALGLTILVRTAYVAPLLASLGRRAKRGEKMKPRLAQMQENLANPQAADAVPPPMRLGRGRGRTPPFPVDDDRFLTRMRRTVADIDYLLEAPLGWREGSVVVWAGMRGAVTVAAAQTLPIGETPNRSLLVLIAFFVAALSLLVQGGTLAPIIHWIKPAAPDPDGLRDERVRLMAMLDQVAVDADADATDEEHDGRSPKQRSLARVAAQRTALLDARDDGTFDAGILASALSTLDAEQISIELQGDPLE